jgi:hypothetical protein
MSLMSMLLVLLTLPTPVMMILLKWMEKALMTLPPPRDIPNGRSFLFQMEN